MDTITCISCKKRLVNDPGKVRFLCPQCGDYDIIRCTSCRSNASRYTCPGCGFVGPN